MTFTSFRRLLAAGAALAILSGASPAFAAPPRSDKVAEPDLTVQAPNGLPINKCVPESLRQHTISFRASDGVRVSGLAFGSGKKGVVLEHEQGWYICSWLPFAQILASKGYNVVLLEARGTGASAKVSEGEHKYLDRDFLAASQELTRRGAAAIVAGGASQGGTAAINSAPKIPSLAGLIAFSSPRDSFTSDPEMDALESVKKVTKPSFFAVSPGDMGNAFVVEVKGLYEASGATEKHYETVGGGIHGVGMMDSPGGRRRTAAEAARVHRRRVRQGGTDRLSRITPAAGAGRRPKPTGNRRPRWRPGPGPRWLAGRSRPVTSAAGRPSRLPSVWRWCC